jgi:hypothetical protein
MNFQRGDVNSTDSQNPQSRSECNFLRGFCYSLLFGVLGFIVPILVMLLITIAQWGILGSPARDRTADLELLPRRLAFPSVGMAWILAATAWATFAPIRAWRFIRNLALLAVISVPSWWILASLGMSSPRYKGPAHPPIYPSEILMLAIPPITVALILSTIKCNCSVESDIKSPPNVAEEDHPA